MSRKKKKLIRKPREVTDWTREETIAKLGKLSDSQIAGELGLSRERVRQVRTKLGIAKRPRTVDLLPQELIERLGTDRDVNLAWEFGVGQQIVREARKRAGIPSYRTPCGTRTRYNSGCRCRDCKDANTIAQRERNASLRTAPSTRTYPAPWTALHEDGTPKTLADMPETRRPAHGNNK